MRLIDNTKLSTAVIAGRTAWNSFHKGGNYLSPTDEITKNDFEFLVRLFKKFKHLSVAEHIWYKVEIKFDEILISTLIEMSDGYLITEIENEKYILKFNLRFILEKMNDDNINVSIFIRDMIKKVLPQNHLAIIYENIEPKLTNENKLNFEIEDDVYTIDTCDGEIISLRIKNISRLCLQELVRHDDLSAFTVKSTRYTLKELKDENSFVTDNNFDFERAKNYIKLLKEIFNENEYTKDYEKIDKISISELETLRITLNKGISNDVVKYILPESYKTELIWSAPLRNLNNFLKLRLDKSAHFEIRELAKKIQKVL